MADTILRFLIDHWPVVVIGYLTFAFIAPVFTATRWTLTRRKP